MTNLISLRNQGKQTEGRGWQEIKPQQNTEFDFGVPHDWCGLCTKSVRFTDHDTGYSYTHTAAHTSVLQLEAFQLPQARRRTLSCLNVTPT